MKRRAVLTGIGATLAVACLPHSVPAISFTETEIRNIATGAKHDCLFYCNGGGLRLPVLSSIDETTKRWMELISDFVEQQGA